MKKILAVLLAIGLLLGSGSALVGASDIPDPSDYDKIPTEWLPLPVN